MNFNLNIICLPLKGAPYRLVKWSRAKGEFETILDCLWLYSFWLSLVVPVKSKLKISQNFVAFSEYKNFTFWNGVESTKIGLHYKKFLMKGLPTYCIKKELIILNACFNSISQFWRAEELQNLLVKFFYELSTNQFLFCQKNAKVIFTYTKVNSL